LKYTTTVDRSGPDYKKREEDAERIAKEMEVVFPKFRVKVAKLFLKNWE
jgi:PAB1-binding protein PBP1